VEGWGQQVGGHSPLTFTTGSPAGGSTWSLEGAMSPPRSSPWAAAASLRASLAAGCSSSWSPRLFVAAPPPAAAVSLVVAGVAAVAAAAAVAVSAAASVAVAVAVAAGSSVAVAAEVASGALTAALHSAQSWLLT
jgi:hypothetical protein